MDETKSTGSSGCTPSNPQFTPESGQAGGDEQQQNQQAQLFFTAASEGFDKVNPPQSNTTALAPSLGGFVRTVAGELTTKAGWSWFQVAQMLYVIIDMAQKIGPDVQKVIEQVKDAWQKMRGG
jgi:hypothetical protein